MRALIVEDGEQRSALAAVRALGAGGWSVGVASPTRGYAARSRWSRCWHQVPTAADGAASLVDAVGDAVERGGYEVVFGAGDAEVLALSAGRHRIGAAVPYPPHDRVVAALDKRALMRQAVHAGLAVPRTWDPAEGSSPPSGPVVVKPRLHGDGGRALMSYFAARHATTAEEVRTAIHDMRAGGAQPLVQELIEGDLIACVALVGRDGRVLAAVQQRSDRIWPPGAGVSVRATTVTADPVLVDRVEVLLAELGWFGLAELQFLVPEDGIARLIDLNGRFYGSLGLCVAAGLNLPAAWASLATGRPLPPLGPPAEGVRYQWLEGDLRRAVRERRRGLLVDLVGCLGYAPGATHSIWDRRDPRPLVWFAGVLIRRGAGRRPNPPAVAPSGRVDLEVATPSVRAEWAELAEAVGAEPFLHPGWAKAWNDAFADGALEAVTVRRGRSLVAVAPVITGVRWRRLPANGETPVAGPLALDRAAAEFLADGLAEGRRSVLLERVDRDAPATAAVLARLAVLGYRCVDRTVLRSPYVDLAMPWSAYDEALGPKRRQGLRRTARRLAEDAGGPVELVVADGSEDLDRLLAEGFDLEPSGWKHRHGAAIVGSAASQRFYTAVARWAADEGWLRLAFLRAGGRAVAFDLCLEQDGVHYLVKTGFDAASRRFGPGQLIRHRMLARASQAGLRSYEFLGNDEPWKAVWTDRVRERTAVKCFPPTLTGRWGHRIEVSARPVARRVRDRLRALVADLVGDRSASAPSRRRRPGASGGGRHSDPSS